MSEATKALFRRQQKMVAQIKPILAGQGPEAQGATLAELVAIFLAGHHPSLRGDLLAMHIAYVTKLLPISEAEIFPNGKPEGWEHH